MAGGVFRGVARVEAGLRADVVAAAQQAHGVGLVDREPGHLGLTCHDEDLDGADEREAQVRDLVLQALVARAGHGVALHDAGAVVDAVLVVACLDLEQARGDGLVAGLRADGLAAVLYAQACLVSGGDGCLAALRRDLGELAFTQALDVVGTVEAGGLELLEVLHIRVADVREQQRLRRDRRFDGLYALEEVILVVAVHAHEPQAVEVAALRELLGALDDLVDRHGDVLGKARGRLGKRAELAVCLAGVHVDADLTPHRAGVAGLGAHDIVGSAAHGCGLGAGLVEVEQVEGLFVSRRNALLGTRDKVLNFLVHLSLQTPLVGNSSASIIGRKPIGDRCHIWRLFDNLSCGWW